MFYVESTTDSISGWLPTKELAELHCKEWASFGAKYTVNIDPSGEYKSPEMMSTDVYELYVAHMEKRAHLSKTSKSFSVLGVGQLMTIEHDGTQFIITASAFKVSPEGLQHIADNMKRIADNVLRS